ncbi:hypothetical protein GJR88_01253 [Dietzia sp. DQ12-45-1b]|nr:hypothetical protein GJR88_01253 [Dietzia sp. DQ12-45-1b]
MGALFGAQNRGSDGTTAYGQYESSAHPNGPPVAGGKGRSAG